jgi:ferritin-like metal-binding protein YciE
MADLNTRDAKLVQYLNEAYGKEKQLETALEAHIAMTTRAPYRKRLQEHLRETKSHAREVERRIKALGGTADSSAVPAPDAMKGAAARATEVVQKAAALAQGPLHAVRGTGEAEKQLKNAKTEYQDEAEEIATYIGIETLADAVGDKETAKVARDIRRQEERMASFLSRLIPTLTKAVAQEEIPAAERNGGRRTRRSSSRRSGSRSTSRSSGSSRAASGRKTSSGTSSRKTRSSSSSRKTGAGSTARKTGTRSTARKTGTGSTARKTGTGSTARKTGTGSTARKTSTRSTARKTGAGSTARKTTARKSSGGSTGRATGTRSRSGRSARSGGSRARSGARS